MVKKYNQEYITAMHEAAHAMTKKQIEAALFGFGVRSYNRFNNSS